MVPGSLFIYTPHPSCSVPAGCLMAGVGWAIHKCPHETSPPRASPAHSPGHKSWCGRGPWGLITEPPNEDTFQQGEESHRPVRVHSFPSRLLSRLKKKKGGRVWVLAGTPESTDVCARLPPLFPLASFIPSWLGYCQLTPERPPDTRSRSPSVGEPGDNSGKRHPFLEGSRFSVPKNKRWSKLKKKFFLSSLADTLKMCLHLIYLKHAQCSKVLRNIFSQFFKKTLASNTSFEEKSQRILAFCQKWGIVGACGGLIHYPWMSLQAPCKVQFYRQKTHWEVSWLTLWETGALSDWWLRRLVLT